jgi:malate/lactate dehydrogenase
MTAQEAVPGFEQLALTGSTIILLGLGGVGSQIALTLARKGAGSLTLLDHGLDHGVGHPVSFSLSHCSSRWTEGCRRKID